MSKDKKATPPNYLRRALGALLLLSPLGLAVASLAWGWAHPRFSHPLALTVGMVLIGLALFVSACNVYFSFIRPLLFQHRPNYRWVSGIPGIGTFLIVAGVLVGFGGVLPATLGIVAFLLDTGGTLWFLIATWDDAGLWDVPPKRK